MESPGDYSKLDLFYIFLVVILIIFFMLIYSNIRYDDVFPTFEFCLTRECLSVNKLYNDYVDKRFDPCEDFEKFACSNYVKTLENSGKYTNGLEASTEKAFIDLQNLLSRPVLTNDRILTRITKAFYRSCLNPDLEAKMNQYIYKQLVKLRPVPLLDPDQPVPNWVDYYKKAIETRENIFSIISVNIELGQANFRDFYPTIKKGMLAFIEEEQRKSRIDLIFKFFSDNGITTSKQMEEDLQEQMNLNNKLVELAANAEEKYGLRTIGHLKKTCPHVDWLKLINTLYEPYKTLNDNDIAAVDNENFLCSLHNLFKGKEEAVVNHIFINFAELLVNTMTKFLQLSKIKSTDRSAECTRIINAAFPIGASYVFIHQRDLDLGISSKQEILRIINQESRHEAKIMVGNEATWLAKKTKIELVKKLDEVVFHFGFLKSNLTVVEGIIEYEEIFHTMEISNEDPLQNYMESLVAMKRRLAQAERAYFINMLIFSSNLADSVNANAWYIPNNILLTHSLIVPLTYKHNGPSYHNYGGLGYIGSHEYGHTLDSGYYIYTADGVIGDFWSKRSEKEYKTRVFCLVNEYNEADEPCTETKINGELTLNENFADLFGLTIARRIYGKWLEKNNYKDLKLRDYSNYTPEQLFWISSALVLCERRKREDCEKWNAEDPHTIGPVRILMNIKMSPYFAKDWKCPENSTMNPEHKCKVF